MAETPFSKILDTIAQVERIQSQVNDLAAAMLALAARIEAIETAGGRSRQFPSRTPD